MAIPRALPVADVHPTATLQSMIILYPDNGWLGYAILLGIGSATATAAVAAFPALRWGWKAWPLMLLAAVAIPIIIAVVIIVALPLVTDRDQASAFLVHGTTLGLIGISSASLAFAVALMWRWTRPKVR